MWLRTHACARPAAAASPAVVPSAPRWSASRRACSTTRCSWMRRRCSRPKAHAAVHMPWTRRRTHAVRKLPYTCRAHVVHAPRKKTPCTCRAHAAHTPCTRRAHAVHMPCTCRAHAVHMLSGHARVPVSALLRTGAGPPHARHQRRQARALGPQAELPTRAACAGTHRPRSPGQSVSR